MQTTPGQQVYSAGAIENRTAWDITRVHRLATLLTQPPTAGDEIPQIALGCGTTCSSLCLLCPVGAVFGCRYLRKKLHAPSFESILEQSGENISTTTSPPRTISVAHPNAKPGVCPVSSKQEAAQHNTRTTGISNPPSSILHTPSRICASVVCDWFVSVPTGSTSPTLSHGSVGPQASDSQTLQRGGVLSTARATRAALVRAIH